MQPVHQTPSAAQVARWPLGLAAVLLAASASAQITISSAGLFRDNEGPNTVGAGSGDNLTVTVRNVSPNLGTFGYASHPALPGVRVPLTNVFLSPNGFVSRSFAADVLPGGGGTLDTPWTVTLQSRGNAAQWTTNALTGVGRLPQLVNLQVTGTDLAPTLQWNAVSTSTPYDEVRLSIYDERTDQLVWVERVIGPTGATSYTLPAGLLAPGTEYSFRVFLWDNEPGVGLVNRSSTYVNRATSDAALSLGTLRRIQAGVDAALVLASGVNSHPNASVELGVSTGNGAARLTAGTTLDATFLNLGMSTGRTGTLFVDGARATFNGGTVVTVGGSTSTGGGFATIGRANGSQGLLTVLGGGELQLSANGFATPGMNIGRDAGSFGAVRVEGTGSRIVVEGLAPPSATLFQNGLIQVGRAGDGRLQILDGGLVRNAANGESLIGAQAGSRGFVQVAGAGSRFEAGQQLQIGVLGEGVLQVDNGGLAQAGTFIVGRGGVISGDGGVLEGLVRMQGGTLAPGNSPGRLTIVGDLVIDSGTLLLEALDAGQIDGIDVQGTVSIGAGVNFDVLLGFAPSSTLDFLTATGGIHLAPGFAGPRVYALLGSGAPTVGSVSVVIGTQSFDVPVTTPVPEPAGWALLLAGLVALRWRHLRASGA
jgi:T5SS/PEP-CTERM-associated repeat protein